MRLTTLACIAAFAFGCGATAQEVAGPPTLEQQVMVDLKRDILGVWSLVTPQFARRIERSKVNEAAERCFKPAPLSQKLVASLRAAAEGEDESSRLTASSFRGDLVYRSKGLDLIRIDYLNQNRSRVSRVVRQANSRGKVLYTLDVGRARLSLMFDDFNLARTENGFMLQGSVLYLKCPPLPGR